MIRSSPSSPKGGQPVLGKLPLDGQRRLELLRHQLERVGLKCAAVGHEHHPDGPGSGRCVRIAARPASCPCPYSHQGRRCPDQADSPWLWSYPTRVSAFGGPSSIPACRLCPGMAVPPACSLSNLRLVSTHQPLRQSHGRLGQRHDSNARIGKLVVMGNLWGIPPPKRYQGQGKWPPAHSCPKRQRAPDDRRAWVAADDDR